MKSIIGVAVGIGLTGMAATASAHYPWLLLDDHTQAKDSEAKVYMAWGHTFPLDGFIPKDRVESLVVISSKGKKIELTTDNGVEYKTPVLDAPGTFWVAASQGKGYFTKTRKGGERAPKTGLSDVVRCFYSDNSMKSILQVDAGGEMGPPLGQSLEIVPLMNPLQMRVGDYLPLQVLYRGVPYDGMVFATYEGFSSDGAYAYSVETDDEGKAKVRMLDRGRWVIKARVEQAYPKPDVCDVEAFTSSFTFVVP